MEEEPSSVGEQQQHRRSRGTAMPMLAAAPGVDAMDRDQSRSSSVTGGGAEAARAFPAAAQDRRPTTRTPPLPSAWTVTSLLTTTDRNTAREPGDGHEMPALDPRRVDAGGTRSSVL